MSWCVVVEILVMFVVMDRSLDLWILTLVLLLSSLC